MRIGLSAGDVLWEEGDCYGTPVVEAARLEAAAEGGQILCSDLVRMMARGRGGHELTPIGALHLKGLPEPLAAFEVHWEDAAAAGANRPLPPALAAARTGSFVGRAEELRVAGAALADIDRPAPTVIWLAGEPGIGKTRLAAELAGRQHHNGWAVLFGRCDEGLAIPYQPFAEALRQFVAHTEDQELGELLGGAAVELAHLCPDLTRRLPSVAATAGASSDQFQLFEAVRGWLTSTSMRQPTLVVIDDAHWATKPSLLLLNYLARTVEQGRVAFVVTLRDTECPDELRAIIDESTLRPGGLHRVLRGLAPADVAVLADAHPNPDPDAPDGVHPGPDAAALHARTAGNPLFVRALLTTGEEGATVQAAIRRRIARLSATVQESLRVGALAGVEFDARVVGRACDLSPFELLDRLEEAERAGLIQEVGGHGFRFSHGLVRDALAEALGPTRRLLVHRSLAEAYEVLRADDPAALARHWSEAADDAESTERAISALQRAGDAAEAASDHGSAALAYHRAVDLLNGEPTERRAILGLALAKARLNGGSYATETEELFLDSAQRAARLGLDEMQLESTLGAVLVGGHLGMPSPSATGALRSLAEHPSEDRRLAARSRALWANRFDQMEERAALRQAEAVLEEAEAVADEWAIRWAHNAMVRCLPYTRSVEAVAHAKISLAGLHNFHVDSVALLWLSNLAYRQLIVGDLDGAARQIELLATSSDRGRAPFVQHVAATAVGTLALVRGDLAAAEHAAATAEAHAARLDGADVSGVAGVQMFALRREQGRLQEIAPMMRIVARSAAGAAWRPGLAAIYAELGMLAEARELLDRMIIGEVIDLPDDPRAAVSLSYLVDAVVAVGDTAKAEVLYHRLAPWSGLTVAAFVIACYGPVDRYLGMLALTSGRLTVAEGHLQDALTQCVAMGSRTYAAHCHLWLARVATARGDHHPADDAARHALDLAIPIGLAGVAHHCQTILHGTQ
ncbi:MAG: ATP-binding protein [Acidimicrobiales bacterium]